MTKTRTGDRLSDNSLVVNAAGASRKDASWLASAGLPSVDAFRPGPGWVLFEREKRAEAVGKVLLSSKSDKDRRYKPTAARVIKVGPPCQDQRSGVFIKPELSVGDRVVLNRFCGHDIEIGGKLYVVAAEADVALVIGEGDVLTEV